MKTKEAYFNIGDVVTVFETTTDKCFICVICEVTYRMRGVSYRVCTASNDNTWVVFCESEYEFIENEYPTFRIGHKIGFIDESDPFFTQMSFYE